MRQLAQHSAAGSAHTMRGYQARRPCLYDLTADISRIAVPVLVMTGDEDEPCLEPSLLLKRTIAGAGLAVLPRSGHAINLEEPALFNRLLEDFLHQVEAGRWPQRDPATRPSIWGPGGKP
jgi:pimeloyl-ACP methyl ester carboxylesterase